MNAFATAQLRRRLLQRRPFVQGADLFSLAIREPEGQIENSKENVETPIVAEVHHGGIELVERLAAEWRELCLESPGDEPFYHPEWIEAYLRAFAPSAKLRVITARAGGRLKAILPLTPSREYFSGLPARILRSPSNVHSCRSDLVRGAGASGDAAAMAIWNHLRESRDWDVLELLSVPAGGAAEMLVAAAQHDGFLTGQYLAMSSPYITLAGRGGEDWWLQQTDSKFRGNLRRRMRKLTAEDPVTLTRIETADPEALQRFYDLEQRGWKGRAGSAIADDAEVRMFYDLAAATAAQQGYFSLYFLEWKGRVLAGHFGLTYKGVYMVPKLAYDEDFQQYAPGHVMIYEVVGDCVRRGLREFDFLGHAVSWKKEWTQEQRTLSYRYIFRQGLLGRALHTVKFKIKPALAAIFRKR